MSSSTAQTDPTLIDRYQNFRTRRFLKYERTYAHSLPGWRTHRAPPSWWSAWLSRSPSWPG